MTTFNKPFHPDKIKYLKEQAKLNNTYKSCLKCNKRQNLKSYYRCGQIQTICNKCVGVVNKTIKKVVKCASKKYNTTNKKLYTTAQLIKEFGIPDYSTFWQISRKLKITYHSWGVTLNREEYKLWSRSSRKSIRDYIKANPDAKKRVLDGTW